VFWSIARANIKKLCYTYTIEHLGLGFKLQLVDANLTTQFGW